ncbi:MAG: hypothetical protein N3E38_00275 [Candidatus Aenigmarchaeota archaeon]|nr:hypothetical protein [Candidatus Aenigmarchaeota archaeon]
MPKNLFPIIFLTVLFFLSGCTQQGGRSGGGTNGLIIESFGPVISEVQPGDSVDIVAVLKNVGGHEVRDIQVSLYGLGDWNYVLTSPPPSSLAPADPTGRGEVETAEVVWTATAPSYRTGIENQEFEMVAYYTYSTSAIAYIKVATESYIKSFPHAEQQNKINELGVKMEKYTDGPISVTFSAPSKIVKADSRQLRVTINIQNVGGGSLVNNELDINIITPGRSNNCNQMRAKLIQGKSKQITCLVDVSLGEGWDNIPVEVHVENYRYKVSATSSISVSPVV